MKAYDEPRPLRFDYPIHVEVRHGRRMMETYGDTIRPRFVTVDGELDVSIFWIEDEPIGVK